MTTHAGARLLGRRWILAAIGLPVLVALWWAFRPEKLWVNQKVNEPAPFDTGGSPQPILTGRFQGEAQPTSGRATIYKEAGGKEYLRLSDFNTAGGLDVHILLAQEGAPHSIDLGPLKGNEGNENYDLPPTTNPDQYDAVVVYGQRVHSVLGSAKLEPF